MSIPPQGSWDAPQPLDPSELPPGFYFAPGTAPHERPPKKRAGVRWLLAALVALLLLAVGIGFAVMSVDGSEAAAGLGPTGQGATHTSMLKSAIACNMAF